MKCPNGRSLCGKHHLRNAPYFGQLPFAILQTLMTKNTSRRIDYTLSSRIPHSPSRSLFPLVLAVQKLPLYIVLRVVCTLRVLVLHSYAVRGCAAVLTYFL